MQGELSPAQDKFHPRGGFALLGKNIAPLFLLCPSPQPGLETPLIPGFLLFQRKQLYSLIQFSRIHNIGSPSVSFS